MSKGAFEHLYNSGAGGYDQNFGHISAQFVPALLRSGRIGPGQLVLDIATGTGIAAAAAAAAEMVGPAGHVTAADISPAMLEQARERLRGHFEIKAERFAERGWMVGQDVIPSRCSKPCWKPTPHVDPDQPCAA